MRYYTPLRYPGGKAAVCPKIRDLIIANGLTGGTYIEPYAGGAAVALELLMTGYMRRVILNDSDPAIYAFWACVLDCPERLIERIFNIELSIDEWRRQRAMLEPGSAKTQLEVGFAAFYLNRVNRSGILRGGVIGGLQQEGRWLMGARFNRDALVSRIRRISTYANKITVTNKDAEIFLKEGDWPRDKTFLYIDPPYFQKGQRLYRNFYSKSDHARLAQYIQNELSSPWLISYDDVAEIAELYRLRRQERINLQYSAQIKRKGLELFVFSDDLLIGEGWSNVR